MADRERARIECFSQTNGESKFVLADSPAFGEALYSIAYHPPGLLYGVTGGAEIGARGGFTLDLLSREVVAVWGRGRLDSPHALALDGKRAVFVGQLLGRDRLLRFAMAAPAGQEAKPSAGGAGPKVRDPSGKTKGVVNIDVSSVAAASSNSTFFGMPTLMLGRGHKVSFWVGLGLVCVVLCAITLLACVRCHRRRRRVGPITRYGPVLRERKGFELLVNQDDDEDVTFDRQTNGPAAASGASNNGTATVAGGPKSLPPLGPRTATKRPPSPLEGEPSTHGELQA